MSEADEIGYAEAIAELDTILDGLEDDDLDVDLLASRVERASHLIKVCRDRITGARLSVEQIVATLNATSSDGAIEEAAADTGPGAIDPDEF